MIFSFYTKQIPRLVEIGWSLHGSYSPLWFHKSLNLKLQFLFDWIFNFLLSVLSLLNNLSGSRSLSISLEPISSWFCFSQDKQPTSPDCPSVVFISRCFSRRTWCEYDDHIGGLPSPQVMSCHPERLHCSATGQLLASFMKGSLLPLVSWSNASYSGPKQK